jgi:sporulation protein YlmC with PRC-barrel domain
MRLFEDALRGKVVIGADGQAIGEIEGINIDTATWTIDTLKVKLRRGIGEQVGTRRGLFRTPALEIPVRAVQSVGDTVVLSMSVAGLRELAGLGEHAKEQPPPEPAPARG